MRSRVVLLGFTVMFAVAPRLAKGRIADVLRGFESSFSQRLESRAALPLATPSQNSLRERKPKSLDGYEFFHLCGGAMLPRKTGTILEYEHPVSPVDLLWRAYSDATSIEVCRLEPVVNVSEYPAGYFGDWVREGFLVRLKDE